MKPTWLMAGMIAALAACGNLTADVIADLPGGDTDTISIQLDPTDGALDGVAGATVGWGFTVNWSSTNGDWVSFTGSSLASETNPSVNGEYSDFIGGQGGPVDFGLNPAGSPWTETFDGVSQGVGAYQIAGDAVTGAEDTGEVTFNFQVYNGDPLSPTSSQIGDASYSYSGASTVFSVMVDASSTVPEPASALLALPGIAGLLIFPAVLRKCKENQAGK